VLGFDDKGRVKLSMKALLEDQAAAANAGEAPAQ
jgi:ribosomal protein S1